MAATNVDMDNAFDVALRLSEENGVWTRKEGLAGIWGPMIYQWLDECLPDDAADICNERVAVSVCHLRPSILPLKRKSYDRFATKKDVIEACMASVHIPFFLDGKVSRWFKGEAYVDGSFTFLLRNKAWHVKAGETQPLFLVHHKMDKDLMAKEWGFLETISPASFKEMFDLGEASMTQMIQQGDLFLPADARGRGDELII